MQTWYPFQPFYFESWHVKLLALVSLSGVEDVTSDELR